MVSGGAGRFFYDPKDGDVVAFLAGGIGFNPFMAMLRTIHASKTDCKVYIFYMVKKKEDIFFRGIMEKLKFFDDDRFIWNVKCT